jgi:hypothetical protein
VNALSSQQAIVDEELKDSTLSQDESDEVFLATFTTLVAISLFISGTLLILARYVWELLSVVELGKAFKGHLFSLHLLALMPFYVYHSHCPASSSVFKLVNLGAFLPFPVLCGFFSSVGVLTWTLAFKVDANGRAVGQVFGSGDWDLIYHCCLHHLPSIVIAAIMKYLGPKNPFYVVAVVFCTIGMFYVYMFTFGVSMEEMVEAEWFWGSSDLVPFTQIGSAVWAPPKPLGWITSLLNGKVRWSAVSKAMETTVALSFLYLTRCSLHGPCLKKNVRNLVRTVKAVNTEEAVHRKGLRRRTFSEAIDIENLTLPSKQSGSPGTTTTIEHAKPTNISLQDILIVYGYSQYISAFVGSFAITPAINASLTMYVVSTLCGDIVCSCCFRKNG